ncbi:MAG TPA: hypothetical protein VK534_00960, partial [Methylomirabilota bacterium]|nr:hypothetical protein [Methylomirabilota bacterium]
RGEGDLTTAPLYIGHMPSAFYKVRAERPEFMSEFEIKHSETIIVIEGVLKVVTDDAYKARDTKGDTNNFRPGQVTRIEKRHLAQDMVNLEPVGVLEPAECLALTIFDDPEIIFDGGRRSLIIRPN